MAKYMFSKSRHIMCEIQEDGKYWVTNGAWAGTRNGDEFTCDYTGSVSTITDWEERTSGKWLDGDFS